MWFLIISCVCLFPLEAAPITRRTTVPITRRTTVPTTRNPTTVTWTLRTTIPTTEPKPTIPTTASTTIRTTAPGTTNKFTTIKTTKIPTTVRPASETTIKQTAVPPGASTASETSGTPTNAPDTRTVDLHDKTTKGKTSEKTHSITLPPASSPKGNEGCLDDLYRCKGGGKCIDYKQVCDGTPDCPGGDDENIFCKDTSIPVVPIVAGVASVVALCAIVAGTVFFVKKRKRSQATRHAVNVDRVRRKDDPPANPPANPRDSHIYAAINPQDMDNNLTVISETPDRSKRPRPDRRHNNTGNILQAPRDSNYATPEDVRGTVYENIPDESPYQALNPDTMENAAYTSRSELANKK
ncbi:uncharacterized protein LOC144915562 [Branchiostoma floridae x Branchiostoma belcheri]